MLKGVKETWQTSVTRGPEKVIFDAGRGRECEKVIPSLTSKQVIWAGDCKNVNGAGSCGPKKSITIKTICN